MIWVLVHISLMRNKCIQAQFLTSVWEIVDFKSESSNLLWILNSWVDLQPLLKKKNAQFLAGWQNGIINLHRPENYLTLVHLVEHLQISN